MPSTAPCGDEDGSVHWGYFDDTTGTDFLKGCANLDRIMVEKGGIDTEARVLDLGCGNGTTAIWLAKNTGCHATGIDLSGVRIDNAKADRERQEPGAAGNGWPSRKRSATDLPFSEGRFNRVWSQAVIYHVPDKRTVLKEVYRVLEKGGIFVFDDLLKAAPGSQRRRPDVCVRPASVRYRVQLRVVPGSAGGHGVRAAGGGGHIQPPAPELPLPR